MENKELIKKADIAIADLATDGGLLEPQQANTFIRTLIKQPTILSVIRSVEMRNPTMKIPKIQFGSRVLRAAPATGTALAAGDRSAPQTDQIELTSKEVIAEIRLPYDVIEDNVERGNLGQDSDGGGGTPASGGMVGLVNTLLSQAVARDLEELAILGDVTTVGDAYLALTDGFIKSLTTGGNVVNHGALPVDRSMFKKGLQAIPPQFHRERPNMRHFLSVNNEIDYRDTLAARDSQLGDQNIQQFNPVFGFGVPVQPVQLMPETAGMLGHPLNFIFGIQRAVSMEYEKLISERVYKIVITARIDFEVEETEASAVYSNIDTTGVPAP